MRAWARADSSNALRRTASRSSCEAAGSRKLSVATALATAISATTIINSMRVKPPWRA